jgi:hypothetical protein
MGHCRLFCASVVSCWSGSSATRGLHTRHQFGLEYHAGGAGLPGAVLPSAWASCSWSAGANGRECCGGCGCSVFISTRAGLPGMWVALLAVSLFCWVKGLRLLPMLVAVALLAWRFGVLESTNLWDYLIDPWLATAALFQCMKFGAGRLLVRFRGSGVGTCHTDAPAAEQGPAVRCVLEMGVDTSPRSKSLINGVII